VRLLIVTDFSDSPSVAFTAYHESAWDWNLSPSCILTFSRCSFPQKLAENLGVPVSVFPGSWDSGWDAVRSCDFLLYMWSGKRHSSLAIVPIAHVCARPVLVRFLPLD